MHLDRLSIGSGSDRFGPSPKLKRKGSVREKVDSLQAEGGAYLDEHAHVEFEEGLYTFEAAVSRTFRWLCI